MSIENTRKSETRTTLSRRAMLMRLGLAAGAAYAAPVLLNLGEAHASSFSGSRSGRSFSGRRRPRRSFS